VKVSRFDGRQQQSKNGQRPVSGGMASFRIHQRIRGEEEGEGEEDGMMRGRWAAREGSEGRTRGRVRIVSVTCEDRPFLLTYFLLHQHVGRAMRGADE